MDRDDSKRCKNTQENKNIFHQSLQEEKLKHKEHRFHLVTTKLLFTTSIFGLSSFFTGSKELYALLLLVPVICFCIDLYIIAADYKVKRIGRFVRGHKRHFSRVEIDWEEYLHENKDKKREKWASINSRVLSIALCICAVVIFLIVSKFFQDPDRISPDKLFIFCALCILTLLYGALIPLITHIVMDDKEEQKHKSD